MFSLVGAFSVRNEGEKKRERESEISFITCFEKDTFFLLKERFLYNARRPKKEHDVREKRGKRRRRGR